ncbi:MAG: RES domain-containing protein [Pseudomonadota bacterium]
MKAFRIGDPEGRFPIWSDGGARRFSGRWHEAGAPVIYTSEHYSTALLEKLVHYEGELPAGQHWIEITLPAGVSYEVVTADTLPGWAEIDGKAARGFGMAWMAEARSCLLFVPSVVARVDRNIIVNTAHPDFGRITPGLETPVWWDERLFG